MFAIKSTFGLIDRFGVLNGCPSLDTVGFYSNDLADLTSIMCACTLLEATTETKSHLNVAVLRDPFIIENADKCVLDMLDGVVDLMQTSDSIKVADVNRTILKQLNSLRQTVMEFEMSKLYDSFCKNHADDLGKFVLKTHRDGSNISPLDYFAWFAEIREIREDFNQLFSKYGCIIMPSAFGEAPEGLSSTGNSAFNGPWTLLGFPVVNLPLKGGPNGMPLGLQVIGASFSDIELIEGARKIWEELSGKDMTYF